MASPKKCKFEIADEVINKPLLVEFSNGQLKPNSSKLINFSLYTNENEGAKKILVAETKNLSYHGTNYDKTFLETNNLCRYYIGTLNKTTRKMKVYNSELFHLQPLLKGSDESLETTIKSEPTDNRKKVDDLTIAFGSQRKRRAIESRLKYNVEEEELNTLMQQTAQEVELEEVDFNKSIGNECLENQLLPVNRAATSLEDVYNIEDIISSKEFEILNETADELKPSNMSEINKWRDENKYPSLVLKILEKLPVNEETKSYKLKLLMYMNYLFVIAKLKYQDLRKKEPLPSFIPYPIKASLLEKFTQSSKNVNGRIQRTISKELKDKVIIHIVALGLITNNYELNVRDLQTELKIPANRLPSLAQSIGARIEKRGVSAMIKLKLPLALENKRLKIGSKKK